MCLCLVIVFSPGALSGRATMGSRLLGTSTPDSYEPFGLETLARRCVPGGRRTTLFKLLALCAAILLRKCCAKFSKFHFVLRLQILKVYLDDLRV